MTSLGSISHPIRSRFQALPRQSLIVCLHRIFTSLSGRAEGPSSIVKIPKRSAPVRYPVLLYPQTQNPLNPKSFNSESQKTQGQREAEAPTLNRKPQTRNGLAPLRILKP